MAQSFFVWYRKKTCKMKVTVALRTRATIWFLFIGFGIRSNHNGIESNIRRLPPPLFSTTTVLGQWLHQQQQQQQQQQEKRNENVFSWVDSSFSLLLFSFLFNFGLFFSLFSRTEMTTTLHPSARYGSFRFFFNSTIIIEYSSHTHTHTQPKKKGSKNTKMKS